jgi:hypothetical protein
MRASACAGTVTALSRPSPSPSPLSPRSPGPRNCKGLCSGWNNTPSPKLVGDAVYAAPVTACALEYEYVVGVALE